MARLGGGKRISPWYVCLGRTARAFATHPAAQRLPETATNRALSAAAGRPLDAAAGAAWLTPEAAEIILAGSREPTAATDLEWPALILRHDPGRLRGLRCEGLEWETPDFHAAEIISAGGLAAWTRATFDTPTMWAARLRLAAASGAALERVLNKTCPTLRASISGSEAGWRTTRASSIDRHLAGCRQARGRMFWFMRKRLPGSYSRLQLHQAIVVGAVAGADQRLLLLTEPGEVQVEPAADRSGACRPRPLGSRRCSARSSAGSSQVVSKLSR